MSIIEEKAVNTNQNSLVLLQIKTEPWCKKLCTNILILVGINKLVKLNQ